MRGYFIHVPIDVAITPANGECLVDRWWAVHPEKGVAFYYQPFGYERSEGPSPQCNGSEDIARRLTAKLNPDHEVRLIPAVFMLHAIREMGRHRKQLLEERKSV